MKIVKDF